jgi:hypothetical protein
LVVVFLLTLVFNVADIKAITELVLVCPERTVNRNPTSLKRLLAETSSGALIKTPLRTRVTCGAGRSLVLGVTRIADEPIPPVGAEVGDAGEDVGLAVGVGVGVGVLVGSAQGLAAANSVPST